MKLNETAENIKSKLKNEDGFKKTVNLDPKEVPNMTLDQKQDCMDEINKYRHRAWIYSIVFSLGTLLFVLVYSMISLTYMLRFRKLLPNAELIVYLAPFITFIPAIFAHMMNGKAIMWAFFSYVAVGLLSIYTGQFASAWIAPFAFAGAILYVLLSKIAYTYEALSKEEGFPEFCNIESMAENAKEIIERNKEEEEPLNPLTSFAIAAAKSEQNKNAGEDTAENTFSSDEVGVNEEKDAASAE